MRLRRLETFGFKSFADRLSFEFGDGVTAVIGPNGCGKSNVVDSIKWVIGEQSAKALRGAEMTDVIFNGCATRRPLSHCEVTLVMDQVNHQLPGLEGEEVAITRRLFRDGLSQYFLNGKPCRLKDIKEIFMGTGMGTSAYSVIEQGRIGFILESNAKDRRLIIEEAAGISRYKARRKVAVRKLERVEQDLVRIGEVLGEVRRRARSVQRQATTALRFRDLQGRAKDLRQAFALEEFGRLSSEHTQHLQVAEARRSDGAEVAARLGVIEAGLTEADAELLALETRIREAADRKGTAQSARDLAEDRSRAAEARLVELAQQEAEDQEALRGIETRLATLSVEHRSAEEEVARLALESQGEERVVDGSPAALVRGRRAELDRVLAEADALVARAEDIKAKQIEAMRELARIEAELGRLESARSATHDRRQRIQERSGGQAEALLAALQAEGQAKTALEAAMQAAVAAHASLDDRIRAREEALAQGNQREQELSDLRHQEARIETSLRLHQDAERRAEGLQSGVRDVLAQMGRMPGIVGMVAELCRVPDDKVVAIETALGQQAQNIIAEDREAAKQAIEMLKREKRGRATFLPLDDIRGRERVDSALLREDGVVGIGSRLVEYEPRFAPAFEYLLGNVLVVETLDHAIAIRRRHQRVGCRLVTLEGEVINAGGAMTGGRGHGHEPGAGVVGRKNEISRLGDQLGGLQERKQAAVAARDAARKLAFELGLATEEARRAIQASDRSVGDAKAALMKCERDRLHLESDASGFGSELEEISGELGRLEAEARELAGQREWFSALERKLAADLDGLQGDLAAKGALRDRLQEEVANLRVSVATGQERLEAARNHLAHLARGMQELEDRRDALQTRLNDLDGKRTGLKEGAAANARLALEEGVRFNAAAEELDQVVKERDRLRDSVEERRQEARVLQARARVGDQERTEAELKGNEAKVRLENLIARMAEEGVDLVESFKVYQRPADLDLPSLRQELETVEREIRELGPVNLAAIDELEEAQEREKFLDRQHGDLTHASERLREVIEELNQVSGRLFSETFRKVSENFKALFRKLFNGGRASLELEEKDEQGNPVDPLEAGLEIWACPPGKNPKIITQLSGGEKAMTSIALLFAVYQTKPSPFCILDEVDAPLDEANVDIFNNMIREFTADGEGRRGSQFIVITHKKRTMQRSDAIYGITQNEPGVSIQISVRFGDVEKSFDAKGELAPTVRGQGPFSG